LWLLGELSDSFIPEAEPQNKGCMLSGDSFDRKECAI
jgi:hypothetical protein